MAKVVGWLSLFITSGLLVLTSALNWDLIGRKLNESGGEDAAKLITDNWMMRPINFFQGITKGSWRKILPLLSDSKIWSIKEEELEANTDAFQVLAEHLHLSSENSSTPADFRLIIYSLISKRVKGSHVAIKYLPASWMLLDGPKVMNILVSMTSSRLWLLSKEALEALLQNPKDSCNLLNFDAIRNLDRRQLEFITSSCMAAIKGIDQVDLSTVVVHLKPNIFEMYNGPLSSKTIARLSGPQLKAYGSLISHETLICKVLELSYLNFATFSQITSRCLYGYLQRPRNYGLGWLWKSIPKATLEEFTFAMRLVWANIYSKDFTQMSSATRSLILLEPYACAKFDQSILTPQIIKDMSGVCLCTMISQSALRVRLGQLWEHVSPAALNFFTNETSLLLRNLDVFDLLHIPRRIVRLYLASNQCTNPSNSFEWPRTSQNHIVEDFDNGQPIFYDNIHTSATPPLSITLDDTVAQFNALNLYDSTLTQSQSESSVVSDRSFFQLLSASTDRVFSPFLTLSASSHSYFTVDSEVHSISRELIALYLGGDVNDSWRANPLASASFCNVYTLLIEWKCGQRIEIYNQLLQKLEPQYWTAIFRHKSLTVIIGGICDFWRGVFDQRQDILEAIGREALTAIYPECILELGDDVLTKITEIVNLLADNAFSKHKVGQLPCKLAALSPAQIGELSKDNIVDPQNPTLEEISEHALSNTSLLELKLLDFQQFTVLYSLQWVFIPKDIRSEALAWHFNLALGRLDEFSSNFTKEQGTLYNGKAKTIVEALNLYLEICQSGEEAVEDSLDLVKVLFAITSDSNLQDQFVLEFLKCPRLRPLVIALAENSDEFGSYLEQVSQVESPKGGRLEIELDRGIGFDRVKLLEILNKFPKVFAGRGAFVKCQGLSDQGGPIRSLVDQLLADIERDLIRPGPKISIHFPNPSGQNKSTVEELKGAADSSPSTTTISGSNCKFAWGISRKAGLVAGLSFSKAAQLGMSLPFEIDSTFYLLLFDKSEATLRNYYEAAYKSDIEGFKQRAFMLYNQDPSGQSLEDVLTRIDRLRFIQLSARADPKEAESDITARGNIMASQEGEEYQLDPDLTPDESLNLYLQSHDDRIFEEFKAFVSEFILGASYCFPSIGHFATIPSTLYGKLSALMASYFNSKPINGDQIVSRIRFFGDGLVQCLIPGRFVNASVVLAAFVQSLERNQLERLIAIWTGASTLSLKKTSLKVKFTGPSVDSQASFDFCGVGGTAMPGSRFFVNPGKQYKQLFSKVVGRLFAPSVKVEADCPLNGGLFAIIRVSSCRRVLEIPKLSAQELINGLVDLINTPVTFIRDG